MTDKPTDELCARCGCYRSAHGEDEPCEPPGWRFTAMHQASDRLQAKAHEGDRNG